MFQNQLKLVESMMIEMCLIASHNIHYHKVDRDPDQIIIEEINETYTTLDIFCMNKPCSEKAQFPLGNLL